MRILVLGGYGEMGRGTVIDLFETFRGEVIVAGRSEEKAKKFANFFKRKKVRWAQVDVDGHEKLVQVLGDCDAVINAAQYDTNLKVMTAALAAGVDYVDLGGLFYMTLKQLKLDGKFKKAGVTAVIGCGAAPGITNVMAAYGAGFFDRVSSIHVQFAGKEYTKHNAPFAVPYSMRTVFDEFSKKPAVFLNGRIKFVEPMSGAEEINFPPPVNKTTCFYTLHSEVATFPSSFKAKGIRNCSFKGGFRRDFVDKVKFLMDVGLASENPVRYGNCAIVPRDFTVKMLNRFIPENAIVNDVEFLRVEFVGEKSKRKKRLVVYCKSVSNKKWNIPAGSWNTGAPPSIAAQMLVKEDIKEKGVLPPELCVNPETFFRELKKRQIRIFVSSNEGERGVSFS